MAVQPEYINPDIAAPVVDIADATHVAFAIDDLPELARQLYFAALDHDGPRPLLDRLRGTATAVGEGA
jgi:hypothetical protein